jgi:hypothetical protein
MLRGKMPSPRRIQSSHPCHGRAPFRRVGPGSDVEDFKKVFSVRKASEHSVVKTRKGSESGKCEMDEAR